jgi:outer membrane lipoprotein SlyB
MIKKVLIVVVIAFAVIGFINFMHLNSDVYAGAQKQLSKTQIGKATTETVNNIRHHDWKFIQK